MWTPEARRSTKSLATEAGLAARYESEYVGAKEAKTKEKGEVQKESNDTDTGNARCEDLGPAQDLLT